MYQCRENWLSPVIQATWEARTVGWLEKEGSILPDEIICINRVKNFVPQKTLKALYFSLFHSHLLYCPIIVSCASKTNIHKIEVMQKKAIRCINNSKHHTHTNPLFSTLQILPYHKIIYKSQLMFFHSIHNRYAPSTFSNTWQTNSSRNPNGKNIFIQFTVYICTVRTWPVTVDQVTITSHPLSEAKTAVKFRSKKLWADPAALNGTSYPGPVSYSPTGLAVYNG